MQRVFALTLCIAALVWVAALAIAPGQLAGGSVLAGWFYDACGLVCHQRPERSFLLSGVQMPVCARCFGLYASGAAGALLAGAALGRRTPPAVPDPLTTRKLLVIAAVPTAATLLMEWIGLAQPGSAVRSLAAVPLGGALGWLLVRTVHASRAAMPAQQLRYHA